MYHQIVTVTRVTELEQTYLSYVCNCHLVCRDQYANTFIMVIWLTVTTPATNMAENEFHILVLVCIISMVFTKVKFALTVESHTEL